jgi:predicted nucleic acid-binding protein
MIYADLPAGETIFLDASVFIHHFEPNAAFGPAATDFLERIENQEINGVTSIHIVSEVAHRLMTIELGGTTMPLSGHFLARSSVRQVPHPSCGLIQ